MLPMLSFTFQKLDENGVEKTCPKNQGEKLECANDRSNYFRLFSFSASLRAFFWGNFWRDEVQLEWNFKVSELSWKEKFYLPQLRMKMKAVNAKTNTINAAFQSVIFKDMKIVQKQITGLNNQIEISNIDKMLKPDFEQLSDEYFKKCENLSLIQQPFELGRISEQINIRDLQNEFELIRALSETKKHKMRLRSNNVFENKKNRYPEQAIFDHSRVILSQDKCDKKNQQGYLNANYITTFDQNLSENSHKIIITQGPIENTVADFKNMLCQQKIQCVVMLCKLIQSGKSRCSDYLGGCQIKEEEFGSDYISAKQINLGQDFGNHSYRHVYYSQWPDKKVPSEIYHIQELIQRIKTYQNVLIHCSAGLGRSGVVAAILLVMISDEYKNQKKLSIFRAVRKMRQYRFGAVQNSQQYKFIYEFFELVSKERNLL